VQALYAKQAGLHVQLDKGSSVSVMVKTSTEFVAGGVQLVSALWSQDVSGVLDAMGSLRTAYQEYAGGKQMEWYVPHMPCVKMRVEAQPQAMSACGTWL
jgi:hypothetical protein